MNKKKLFIIGGVILLIVAAVLVWFVFLGGGGKENDEVAKPAKTTSSTQDIAAVITGNNKLTDFKKLLTASGVIETIKDPNTKYIVVSPTNDAIKKLPAGFFDTLFDTDKSGSAIEIAKYHVVPLSDTVTDTLTNGQKLKTLSGQEIIVGLKEGVYSFTSAKGDTATASQIQKTANGTVYVADTFLLPQ